MASRALGEARAKLPEMPAHLQACNQVSSQEALLAMQDMRQLMSAVAR